MSDNVEQCFETDIHTYIEEFSAISGPGRVVGIVTGYWLDGPGIESRWGLDFPHLSRLALGPLSLLYNGYWVFSRGRGGRGVGLTPPPPSSAEVLERVELYLHSPQGPSWPVNRVKPIYQCN